MERTARLTFGDQTIELPVIEGSEGELGVDITSLRAQTGLITLDPGFANTGATRAASLSLMVRTASSAIVAFPSINWPGIPTLSRQAFYSSTGIFPASRSWIGSVLA